MELWDIYDRDRIRTGKTMERGSPYPEGAYHLVVHVCIFNTKNEMLIQQRQPFKDGWSNKWDVTMGGSAVAGDSSQKAAERELLEELGYKANFDDIRPHITVYFEPGFDDYYLIEDDVDITKLKLQYEEVQQVKWATKDEILELLENGDFIPYYKNFIELLFDMRKRYSARRKQAYLDI